MKAICLWQPWPWLIFRPDIKERERILDSHVAKDCENRPVHWKHTGELVLCATLKLDPNLDTLRADLFARHGIVMPEKFDTGGIVGVVTVGPMMDRSESPWFTGPFAWPIIKRRIVPFQTMTGRQGLFELKPNYEKYVKDELAKL